MWTTLKHYGRYLKPIGNHWFLFLVVYGGVCFLISGHGEGFGVPYLFRDDPELDTYSVFAYGNSPAFLTQAAAAFLGGFLWTFARLLEDATEGHKELLKYVLPRAVLLALIPLFAAWLVAPSASIPGPKNWELFRMFLGTTVGLLLTLAFVHMGHAVDSWFRIGNRWGVGRALRFLLMFIVLVIPLVALYHKLVPAISIFLLLAYMSAGYVALQLLPQHWRVLGCGALIVLIVFGNSVTYKYHFPGFEVENEHSYYDDGKRVALADPRNPHSVAAFDEKQNERDKMGASFLISPLTSLKAWRKRFPDKKPKMVLVATSGGAYRASFWTAIVLDLLETKSKEDVELLGLTANIRLITGASGGMVGAAYFVATRSNDKNEVGLVERLVKDTRDAQEQTETSKGRKHTRLSTKYPIPRDSLSPVAQQWAQRDVLNTFSFRQQDMDRGRVLEMQWLTLDKSFKSLRQGEFEGWRPSLILSPMLVETGQPLLISNLDLSSILDTAPKSTRNTSLDKPVEFFRWFPGIHDSFLLQTAVRMNATFPYVSPAVSLPTEPLRRVVDAGYYDNYGINLIVAYLREPAIQKWVQDETSGVVIVQIRAFPIDSVGDERGSDSCSASRSRPDKIGKDSDSAGAFHWLTSPIEGAAAARDASMVSRNNQELRALKNLYPLDFINWVTFENGAKASMSWYLPGHELKRMLCELDSTHNKNQLKRLRQFWTEASSHGRK